MDKVISLEVKNRVGYIIINRPKANCYEINFHKQLIATIDEANSDERVKVMVLKSALEKFFSAGADIKVFESKSVEDNMEMVRHAQLSAKRLSQSEKITIAAIAGHALGGGLELAMACDIRLGSEGRYLLGLPEVKLGLMPGNGGTQRLIRLIDKSKALELLITGDNFGPQKAFEIGLFHRLYPLESFCNDVEKYAEKLAQGPMLAIASIKKAVNLGAEMNIEDALKLESDLADSLLDTEDAVEGNRAFVEKRDPKFN